MNTPSAYKTASNIDKTPAKLKQLASGLQELTESEIETLELLLETDTTHELLARVATLPNLIDSRKLLTPKALWKKLDVEQNNR